MKTWPLTKRGWRTGKLHNIYTFIIQNRKALPAPWLAVASFECRVREGGGGEERGGGRRERRRGLGVGEGMRKSKVGMGKGR